MWCLALKWTLRQGTADVPRLLRPTRNIEAVYENEGGAWYQSKIWDREQPSFLRSSRKRHNMTGLGIRKKSNLTRSLPYTFKGTTLCRAADELKHAFTVERLPYVLSRPPWIKVSVTEKIRCTNNSSVREHVYLLTNTFDYEAQKVKGAFVADM